MNEFEKSRIHFITDKMMKYNISKVFSDKVDITLDDFVEYGKIIKEPMDFLTIKERVEKNYYTSIDKWKYDMNLVFDNAMHFYEKKNTIYILAEQLKMWFNELLEKYPPTAEKWQESLEKNAVHLVRYIVDNIHTKPAFSAKIQQVFKPKSSDIDTKEYKPVNEIEEMDIQMPSRRGRKSDIDYVKKKKETLPKDDQVTESDKQKIYKIINEITKEEQLKEVLALLQRKEPLLKLDESSAVSLYHLKVGTLKELKSLVYSF
jgi:hypothetical protein